MKSLIRDLILAIIIYTILIYSFVNVMKEKDKKKISVDKQEKVVENENAQQLRFEQIVKDSFYEER